MGDKDTTLTVDDCLKLYEEEGIMGLVERVKEISFKAGIKEVVEIGDALLSDVYWRGKFSVGEIRQFWNQLKERAMGG